MNERNNKVSAYAHRGRGEFFSLPTLSPTRKSDEPSFFISNQELSETVEPRMRNFHNPAPRLVSIVAAHLFFTARAHVRLIVALHNLRERRHAAKARIRAQVLRMIRLDLGALDDNRIQRSRQLRHVVTISPDYDDRQRDATRVDQEHSLAPIFFPDPSGWVRQIPEQAVP